MSEPDITEIRQCPLSPEGNLQKRAWVAVDNQGNAVSVCAVLQIDQGRMKDCALYTTPSWRKKGLAKRLFLQAQDDLAAEAPRITLEWSGIATEGGYGVAGSLALSASDEDSAKWSAELDKKFAENPHDERLQSYLKLRDDHGGRLPYNPLNQETANQAGRQALREAAEALRLRVIDEE
ncbi:GNAT family N-acetyltransferase [Nocardia sp. AB354]|uniref:GNAT family N-acetyltransferase n=1 Tax=Nocardia sp. AB354 TaxID=3413283 RepID=UPI003C2AA999